LNEDTSVIPYQYSITWFADAWRVGPKEGGDGGGPSITGCNAPGLITGIHGHVNENEIVSLGIQCATLSLASGLMQETGRYWAGAVGGQRAPLGGDTEFGGTTGDPFEYTCPPGKYLVYYVGNDADVPGNLHVIQNFMIRCASIGTELR